MGTLGVGILAIQIWLIARAIKDLEDMVKGKDKTTQVVLLSEKRKASKKVLNYDELPRS